ncbi:MAG: TadE family protein [Candidatus Limnocylindria bacterium]
MRRRAQDCLAGSHSGGQAMVELMLVLPLFLMILVGIIVLGMGIFFQQQVTNAAREAARFAAIHSATAQRSVVGWLDPNSEDPPGSGVSGTYAAFQPDTYNRWDEPSDGWPNMTAHARSLVFGLNSNGVHIAACWSGYRNDSNNAFDAPPDELTIDIGGTSVPYATTYSQCTIDSQDPTTNPDAIGCTPGLPTHDEASSMSEGQGVIIGNRVTAYACYVWTPPLAGFLLIPGEVALRAVITEPIQRQQ